MVPFVFVQILGESLRAGDVSGWSYLADHNNASFSKYLTRQNKASAFFAEVNAPLNHPHMTSKSESFCQSTD